MANDIYILSACDAQSSWNTMRTSGVTTDKTMLYAMLAAKIKAGEMEYGGYDGIKALQTFQRDFLMEEINLEKLKYGFVEIYEDMQITNSISMEQFPEAVNAYEEITGEKAKAAIDTLGLSDRSLTFSVVEVRSNHDYMEAYLPGTCDRDTLENSDQYQEFVEDLDKSEITVCVRTYSLGNGESDYPDENELTVIEQYMGKLDEEYGVDEIQQDFFSFQYEAEQEY